MGATTPTLYLRGVICRLVDVRLCLFIANDPFALTWVVVAELLPNALLADPDRGRVPDALLSPEFLRVPVVGAPEARFLREQNISASLLYKQFLGLTAS